MSTDMHPRKSFIIQVVTVVHTSHSHNIAACRKRLDTAWRLFSTTFAFDALFDSLAREAIEEIGNKLTQLRDIDGASEEDEMRIKSDCLVTVRRLHDIVKRVELHDPAQEEPDDVDSHISTFGWIRATG